MNYLTLVLRLIHIIGGIFWVGAALMLNFFVSPAVRASGDAGKQVIGHLMAKTRFSTVMTISALSTVLAGFLLYAKDSAWFTSPWQTSGPGIGFGLGGLFALMGLVTGFMNGGNSGKLAKIGAQIQGKPTHEQAAALAAILKQQAWVVPVNSYALLIAALLMGIARYLVF